MVNLKSLFAILTVIGILFVPLGIVVLGIDFWSYHHSTAAANSRLDYRGATIIVMGLVMAAIFFGLFLMRKH